MSIYNILQEIKNNSSTLAKLEILKSNKDSHVLKNILRLTYSPEIKFYLSPLTNYKPNKGVALFDSYFNYALWFLENVLASRSLTGNAASEATLSVLNSLTENEAEIINLIWIS